MVSTIERFHCTAVPLTVDHLSPTSHPSQLLSGGVFFFTGGHYHWNSRGSVCAACVGYRGDYSGVSQTSLWKLQPSRLVKDYTSRKALLFCLILAVYTVNINFVYIYSNCVMCEYS